MGRLEIQVRHGHSNGPAQWGAVVALIVLVLFAAAGHHEIAAMMHEALAITEIAAGAAFAVAVVTLALVITVRTRAANRRRREAVRRADAMAEAALLARLRAYGQVSGDGAYPALGQVRPDMSWPSPGEVTRDEYRYPF